MEFDYTPKGVCSRNIHVEVEDGIVKDVQFTGGCSGNTQGVARNESRRCDCSFKRY